MNNIIFGGTGFLGEALIDYLTYRDERIIVFARNEKNLVLLKNKYPNIEIIVGDINDTFDVKKTFALYGENANVFILSAIKGVDIAEEHTRTTCKTNILGLINILDGTLQRNVSNVMFISTDKASQVSGVYGATKLIGEALMREYEKINTKTNYRVVRYGNVLWSSGSVLEKWRDAILKSDTVKITNPEMTRFFWTRENAIDLIFQCLREAKDSKPFVPQMKSMSIGNLLEAMFQKLGKRTEIEIIGNRGGENLHETMDGKTFSNQVEQYTIEEIKKII